MVQKIFHIILVFCVLGGGAEAQTNIWQLSYNKSRVYTSADTWLDKVEYENGLGDVIQQQDLGVTPQRKDLVTLTEYDNFRRVSRAWQPAVLQTNGNYVGNMSEITASSQRQVNGDSRPFTEYSYVASPQGEVSSRQFPGEDWYNKNKKIKCNYGILSANDGNYDILCFMTFLDETVNCFPGMRQTLRYVETVDEDGQVGIEYFDVDGQKVLERKVAGRDKIDTYYLYDYRGNVICVMPEGLVEFLMKNFPNRSLDDDIPEFKAYAYRYKYDSQGHCVYKRLPSWEPIYYVYDKMGRCIFSQDGEQRDRGEWQFTIPDRFGREVLRGICKNVMDYKQNQFGEVAIVASADGNASNFGYSVSGVKLASPSILIATFYDDYAFLGKFGFPNALSYHSPNSEFRTSCYNAKGMLTGQAKALFGEQNDVGYIYASSYYDDKGQLIQKNTTTSQKASYNDNQCGIEQDSYTYSYTGKVLRHNHVHKGTTSLTEDYVYLYDHADRLLGAKYKISSSPEVTLFSNTYDELGRLQQVRLHGVDNLQTSYNYNVRSWLTGISSGSRFQENIYYNEFHNSNVPCYGGNISAMDWKTDEKIRGYNFEYDGFSKLLKAQYLENNSKNSHYSTSYTYDKMGNITSLQRNGLQDGDTYGLIDNLVCQYDGNLVTKVDDKVEDPTYNGVFNFMDGANEEREYEYDKNGNLVKDLNKKISKIEYNSLNLPQKVEFEDGKSVEYLYDATGVKHQVTYTFGYPQGVHNRTFCGNMIYTDGQLSQILVDGGYVTLSNSTPLYHYYIKDHLGSNRVVVDSDGKVEQVNHYYPFGGLMAEGFGNASLFKYNGKELDRMNGLDWYDYVARWYDAGLCRFWTQDPRAFDYTGVSPYAYCLDNPIRLIDVDGEYPGDFFLTLDAAALDFAKIYNGRSILDNVEYASSIVAVYNAKGVSGYTYLVPNAGNENHSKSIINLKGHTIPAIIHTHGKWLSESDGYFSGQAYSRNKEKTLYRSEKGLKNVVDINESTDIGVANKYQKIMYVSTPNGDLKKYNPKSSKVVIVSRSIPSDGNSPQRVNFIFPSKINVNIIKCLYNTWLLLSNKSKRKNEQDNY